MLFSPMVDLQMIFIYLLWNRKATFQKYFVNFMLFQNNYFTNILQIKLLSEKGLRLMYNYYNIYRSIYNQNIVILLFHSLIGSLV